MNANVSEIRHPLVQQKLTYLRDKRTVSREFRKLLSEITALMVYEITKDLTTSPVSIETPLENMESPVLSDSVVLIPVLRAGLGMLDGALDLLPTARVGHIGLFRDESTLQPVEYYAKFPSDLSDAVIIVLDPMLATGGSSSAAIGLIKRKGGSRIRCLSLVSAPAGLERMFVDHPDVMIYTASVDRALNDKGYIVPGLGDAGDRLYGTK